jgi:hypothetical protein
MTPDHHPSPAAAVRAAPLRVRPDQQHEEREEEEEEEEIMGEQEENWRSTNWRRRSDSFASCQIRLIRQEKKNADHAERPRVVRLCDLRTLGCNGDTKTTNRERERDHVVFVARLRFPISPL